jgi:hypothetical protein
MTALVICILAFGASFWAGKRSLGLGLIALFTVGYFYGILRANLPAVFSHFIFDAGLLGLYFSQKWTSPDPREAKRLNVIRLTTAALFAWPVLLVVLPFQPLLVSLVGLRGNIFFIPILLLGSRLREKDLLQVAVGLAVLNMVAAGFASMEYFVGVPRFYPFSAVTQIIYASGDVAGGFFRIPAIFTSAHAYGGAMVSSLPFVIGGWQRAQARIPRLLAVLGIGAALLGVLMSATRLNFILGATMVLAAVFTTRMKTASRVIFGVLIVVVALTAMANERFQRFKSLGDADAVVGRVAGSVNRGLFEILLEYPMGNGLGGGGTSIPYFLEGQVKNPIGMESEYARILCEQGVIGLLLWLIFIAWFLTRAKSAFSKGAWASGRRMAWCLTVFYLATGWIGVGLFTSIPGTVMLLLSMGWTAVPMSAESSPSRRPRTRCVVFEPSGKLLAAG